MVVQMKHVDAAWELIVQHAERMLRDGMVLP